MVVHKAALTAAAPAAQFPRHEPIDHSYQAEEHKHRHGQGQHTQTQGVVLYGAL